MLRTLVALATAAASLVAAAPVERAGAWDLSADVVATWHPMAHYAAAVYCGPDSVRSWSCGVHCDHTTKLNILATGGDNGYNPYYYVGTNGSHVIVSIAGTNPLSPDSIGIDIDFDLVNVDTKYFPGSSGVQVHHGFYGAFTRMAGAIGPAVQNAVKGGTKQVLVTGHSLGGAQGHLVATYLQKLLGSSATVSARVFASPRVGNPAWANYVDATLGNRAQHMVNNNDVVPQLPPGDWGFQQSSNEIWITRPGGTQYRACPGQENYSCQDGLGIVGAVVNFALYLDAAVHLGPYVGVWISSLECEY
ncbi:hypothetical protein Q8F55_005211 [Vanrija albida]|uniref:Fungal lipase-type domain-containing protein n=1 Tax=Vanrija albida TaxID=181172 RepID=A0ABR3Q101_9TREE